MSIAIAIKGDTMIVRLRGELDMDLSVPFKSRIHQSLNDNPGLKNIVIFMDGVTFIDSTGLAAILGRYNEVKGMGGQIRLVGASRTVKRLLSFSGVDKLIPLCDTEQDAIKSLGRLK